MKKIKLLSKLALSFEDINNFNKDMTMILNDIGKYMKLSEIYICIYEENKVISKEFKWCKNNLEEKVKRIQEKYPIIINNKENGFIIFSNNKVNRKWNEEELEIFKAISGIISSACDRKNLRNEITQIERIENKCIKLNNAIEATDLATWEWNIQTDTLEVNEQWAQIIGYSLKDLEPVDNETWIRSLHPEDVKVSDENLQKHIKGETEYYECDLRVKHRDGKIIWIRDRGKIIERDENGEAVKMFGTHSDITRKKKEVKTLRERERRFFLALDKTKAGLWDIDMSTGDVFFSSMWKRILGYENDEIEDSMESWKNLWHPDDKEMIEQSIDNYLKGKSKKYEITYRLKHKDGSWRWILSRGGILYDEDKPYRWIGTNTDVTKEQEQSLELERIFTVNLDLLCILDLNGYFLKTNEAWEDILGYGNKELEGKNILEFVHKDDISLTLEMMEKLRNFEKIDSYISRYKTKSGKYYHLEWRANPHEGKIYAAARDVSERIKYEKRILEISNRDSLTNVYNRRYIFDRLEDVIEEYKRVGKTFSICIIDIDYFKKINDTYGHQIGDCVLKEFTDIISKNLRKYDILGRYGGEEFIIILNNASKEEGNLVIERILTVVREKTFVFNEKNIEFTFSAGISNCFEVSKKDITSDKLVEIADKRMYQAKNAGRNRIVI